MSPQWGKRSSKVNVAAGKAKERHRKLALKKAIKPERAHRLTKKCWCEPDLKKMSAR